MVMQTVRSRCNSAVLPYVVHELKKVEYPVKIESPTMSRQSRDAISDSTAQLRRSPPSSPRNSILLHKEKAGLQSSVEVLMVLAVLVGTLFIGCIISNDNLNEKISTMERLREELRLTQAGINAQIQRNQRRYNSDVTSYSNAASMDDQVKSLKAYIEQLTLSLADERKVTTQTKQDLDLLTERAREVEFASSQQKQVLITALQGIARRQAQYEYVHMSSCFLLMRFLEYGSDSASLGLDLDHIMLCLPSISLVMVFDSLLLSLPPWISCL